MASSDSLPHEGGVSLRPEPPVATKHATVRYLHIREGESADNEQIESWVRQAAKLPGERLF